MDLDLGNGEKLNVKAFGQEHELRVPSVMEGISIQKKIKDKKGQEVEVFFEFVSSLGLPKNVAERLDLSQMKKLSDNILGMSEKK